MIFLRSIILGGKMGLQIDQFIKSADVKYNIGYALVLVIILSLKNDTVRVKGNAFAFVNE